MKRFGDMENNEPISFFICVDGYPQKTLDFSLLLLSFQGLKDVCVCSSVQFHVDALGVLALPGFPCFRIGHLTFLPSLGIIEAEGASSVSPLPKRYRLHLVQHLQAAFLFASVTVIVTSSV